MVNVRSHLPVNENVPSYCNRRKKKNLPRSSRSLKCGSSPPAPCTDRSHGRRKQPPRSAASILASLLRGGVRSRTRFPSRQRIGQDSGVAIATRPSRGPICRAGRFQGETRVSWRLDVLSHNVAGRNGGSGAAPRHGIPLHCACGGFWTSRVACDRVLT